jgi:hypothetical protein
LIPNSSSEDDVRNHVGLFCEQFKNPDLRAAYSASLNSMVKDNTLKSEAAENGILWGRLEYGCQNMIYEQIDCLADVMLDEKIEEVFCYIYGEAARASPSMWEKDMRNQAFGVKKEPVDTADE